MDAGKYPPLCRNCQHFCNDPTYLEQAIPGLTSMSSAYASVRSEDGLCSKHDRYLSEQSSCSEFALRQARESPAVVHSMNRMPRRSKAD